MLSELKCSNLRLRNGAGYVEKDDAMASASLHIGDELDDLGAPVSTIDSITRLVERKQAVNEFDRWMQTVAGLSDMDTQTLILKVETTRDPLTLWELHVQLDKRNIAPCLRWPANRGDAQMEFISWLADLLWFSKRNPLHVAKFRAWQKIVKQTPESPQWLEAAYRIFLAMYGRQNVSGYTARGLGLENVHRQDLMMLPTARMFTARLVLQPSAFEQTRVHLLSHAIANPDKSKTHSAEAVARRRARLWRTHVLSGKQPAKTARNWAALTGAPTSRQVIARQVATIEGILSDC